MNQNQSVKWAGLGFIWLVGIGTLIHFAYQGLGKNVLVGIFCPVNESVWEHLKLGFTSLLLFSVIEYALTCPNLWQWLGAKALGLFVLQMTILGTFYSYTALVHHEILWVDILSYVVGSFLCQGISYRILLKEKVKLSLGYLGVGFIMLHILAVVYFTFAPPKIPIFQDHNTMTYGIYAIK